MMVKKVNRNLANMDQLAKNNNSKFTSNNNKTNVFPKSSLTDTSSHNGEKVKIGCWAKFLDCLGLGESRGERLMSEEGNV